MVRRIGEPLRRPLHAHHVPSGGGADRPRALCYRGPGRTADAGHRGGPRRLAGLDGLHGGLVAGERPRALSIPWPRRSDTQRRRERIGSRAHVVHSDDNTVPVGIVQSDPRAEIHGVDTVIYIRWYLYH